jgi:hypothetical protein
LRKKATTLAAALAAVALLAVVAAAQETVKLAGGRVSFVPPAGFKPLSREDVLVKFGRRGEANAPELVYANDNERQTVTVAVGFNGQNVPADRLPEVKQLLEADFERSLPGLKWRTREIVELNGARFIHFHLRAAAVDTEIVNDVYVTVFDGRLLIFNFNSTAALYDAHREALEKSARTITVKP